MTTALITHQDCLNHITPPGHPERVERLEVLNKLFNSSEFSQLQRYDAPIGKDEHIKRAHPQEYIDQISQIKPTEQYLSLDQSTYVSAGSIHAAKRAVGANILAVDLVLQGKVKNVFCAVRPPGHHTEKSKAMGFCLFGNVIIGALHALDHYGLKRVGIVDFDVHHGNGTSDIAWSDARIFLGSTHEMPLFPGTGLESETGEYGQIVNVPLNSGSNGIALRQAMSNQILPRLIDHQPECVFISAGFDAHIRDPLATLRWVEDDFHWVTNAICEVANACCDGRIISTLEGGYDLTGLRCSASAHVRCLMNNGRQ